MSIFDTLKKKAIESGMYTEDSETAPDEKNVDKPVTPLTPLRPTTVLPTTSTIGVVAPDQETIKALNDAANASRKPGYPEFRVIFDTLGTIPESQRYDTSLKVVAASNKITPADVLASLDDRIALVEREATDFGAAYQQQVNDVVVAKQNEVKAIEDEVAKKKAEIQALEAKRITIAEQAGKDAVELERNRAIFNASYDVVRTSLNVEREHIKTFVIAEKK